MSSGFHVPDLFPRFTGILSVATGMRRKLHGIRHTVDGILEEIICEREEVLKQARGDDGKQEDNLVDVLLGLQENGDDFGFPMTRNTIKAIILKTGRPAARCHHIASSGYGNARSRRRRPSQVLQSLAAWLLRAQLVHPAQVHGGSSLARHRRQAAGSHGEVVGRGPHRDGDHRVSFTGRGWLGFVSANGISSGQLLVFEHRGGLDFTVDLFDASGCLSGDGSRDEDDDEQRMAETTGDKESGNCRRRPEATGVRRRRKRSPGSTATTGSGDDDTLCRRIERPYQLRFLDLSKSFCDRVGWTSSRDVELVAGGDEQRRRWPVSVKVSAKSGMMCAGWTEFAQGNGVGLSDACAFVPLEGSHGGVLHVRVIKMT
ncbi:hypothetical protein C2845_PM06G35500 [Panicum miliaceum]|uniref:TF-B3 domain-containing protein n=1 Tax=Panicum miliaceum TaxID=4540 RepID=A0A3L6RC18_PANMI|nr:hypothetical protein C2845_PM06G35500 [Panicum miliaceum]